MFEPDIAGGFPSDGAGSTGPIIDCGLGGNRWFFGTGYLSPYVANDMTVCAGAAGATATAVDLAWYWGDGNLRDMHIAVLTSETFDDTCAGPATGAAGGVLLNFGQSAGTSAPFYYANVDLCGAVTWALPSDGSGAYQLWLGSFNGGTFTLDATPGTQPMLWGTDGERPGDQGPIQWADDNPTDGDWTAPTECYDYSFGVCPDPLGAMIAFRVDSAACIPCDTNCDGTVNIVDISSFVAVLQGGSGCSPCAADTNGDGTANFFDIAAFLACLQGGHDCSVRLLRGQAIAGTIDGFVGPEPSAPSPALVALMTCAATQGFDETGVDKCFGHTFALPPDIQSAMLTLHLRAGPSSAACNDSVNLGIQPGGTMLAWGRRIGTGGGICSPTPAGLLASPWTPGADATITLNLAALPNADGTFTNLLPLTNSNRALDILIQDDTNIDYLRLKYTYYPPDCNGNDIRDACDVDPTDPDGNGLVSSDCNGNGIPDECEPDCNENGIPDACECGLFITEPCPSPMTPSVVSSYNRSIFLERFWVERDGDPLFGKGEVIANWANQPGIGPIPLSVTDNFGATDLLDVYRTNKKHQHCTGSKTYKWCNTHQLVYHDVGALTSLEPVPPAVNLSVKFVEYDVKLWPILLAGAGIVLGVALFVFSGGLLAAVGLLVFGVSWTALISYLEDPQLKGREIGRVSVPNDLPNPSCGSCDPGGGGVCRVHPIIFTPGNKPGQAQFLWFDPAMQGTLRNDSNDAVAPELDLIRYEFYQLNSVELGCRVRFDPLANLMTAPLGSSTRALHIFFNTDVSSATGDPAYCGADYDLRVYWTQSNPSLPLSEIYVWCSGAWQPTGRYPHEIEPMFQHVQLSFALKDIGVCAIGCPIASWVAVELNGVISDTIPDNPCSDLMQISITADDACPMVMETKLDRATDGALRGFRVSFSEPVRPLTAADLTLSLPGQVTIPFTWQMNASNTAVTIKPPVNVSSFPAGRLTLRLNDNDTIADPAGNILDGDSDGVCGGPAEIVVCSPETRLFALKNEEPAREFAFHEPIFAGGSGFPPSVAVKVYLVAADSFKQAGDRFIDLTPDGPNAVTTDAAGNLPITNLGPAVLRGEFDIVADVEDPQGNPPDGVYDPIDDRVFDLCGFGLEVEPCKETIDDMVACWPFDEGFADGATTELLSANHGIYVGNPTPIAGRVNNALHFGGSDRVEVANSGEFDVDDSGAGNAELSIECFIRTSAGSGLQPIVDKRAIASPFNGYTLYLDNGRLAFGMETGGVTQAYGNVGAPLADGAWHHVAACVQADTNPRFVRLYVDGVLVSTAGNPVLAAMDNTQTLYVGGFTDGLGYWHGDIDELSLYERALSAAEVGFIHQAGSKGRCTDGVACDANCDGSVNQFDIAPFINLLNGTGPPCTPLTGDTNHDGSINQFDIDGFLNCLTTPR